MQNTESLAAPTSGDKWRIIVTYMDGSTDTVNDVTLHDEGDIYLEVWEDTNDDGIADKTHKFRHANIKKYVLEPYTPPV